MMMVQQNSLMVAKLMESISSLDKIKVSFDQSKVSNMSNVQKELRPNKVVNKGNSVFSNSHKYSKPQDSQKEKSSRIIELTEGSHSSNGGTMKLNAHQIKPPNSSFK